MKRTLMTIVLPLLVLPSCSLTQKEEPVEPSIQIEDSPVGIVNKVNKAAGYVFIRRYRAMKINANDIWETRGETDGVRRSANILATGESLGEHVAADIRSGDVQVGDGVYIRKASDPEEPNMTLDPLYDNKKSTFLDN